jgi:hypothetical protein
MAKQEYEFTLVLSGVPALTRVVLDALFEAGCDDALIGLRDGVAFAEFCRTADSFRTAVLSAIHDVESAGIGARVEHVEPDELVTMSEIARRLHLSREGVRKWVAGLRGPGNFPPPAGSLTRRSPLWRWTDVVRWHQQELQHKVGEQKGIPEKLPGAGPEVPAERKREKRRGSRRTQGGSGELPSTDMGVLLTLGSEVAACNAALDLRRRMPLQEAVHLLESISAYDTQAGCKRPIDLANAN